MVEYVRADARFPLPRRVRSGEHGPELQKSSALTHELHFLQGGTEITDHGEKIAKASWVEVQSCIHSQTHTLCNPP